MIIIVIVAVIAMIISIVRISIAIDMIITCDCCDGGKMILILRKPIVGVVVAISN